MRGSWGSVAVAYSGGADSALVLTAAVRALGFRPGIRAGDERGVRTPLRELGLTKADVRAISHIWDLPTAAKPASPCLASRARYGLTITPHRLVRIDRAETGVRTLMGTAGLVTADLRVRDLDTTVRVEVDPAVTTDVRALPALTETLARAGFADSTVEVAAFRSGILNTLT